MIDGALPAWRPERVSNAIDQDDLYVEMTFAEVLDRKGLDATSADFGEAFRTSKYDLWHANAAARRLLNAGIAPPQSGMPQYNAHANDIDFQIESDFIGLMSPGLPGATREFCERVGSVMNSGDGLYGGLFITSIIRRRSSRRIRVGLSKRVWRRCPRTAATPPSFATCWPGTTRTLMTGVSRGAASRRRGTETMRVLTGRSAPSTSTRV